MHPKNIFFRTRPMRSMLILTLFLIGVLITAGNSSAQTGEDVTMVLLPSTTALDVGDTVDVVVQIQSGSIDFNVGEVHLLFDPAVLQVQNVDGGTALPQMLPGNGFDNTNGTVDYTAGINASVLNGNVDLVTITFNAIAPSVGTDIDFAPLVFPTESLVVGIPSGTNVLTILTDTTLVINEPPIEISAADDSYSTNEDTLLTVSAPGVLANDDDGGGDPLTAVLVSDVSNGSLTLNSDGSFSYTPDAGFTGSDSFTYQANDGSNNSNVATVTITVNPVAGGTATITIVEETTPFNSKVDFRFGGDFGVFRLDDAGGDDGDEFTDRISFTVDPGTYRITQAIYSGWNLLDIVCTPSGGDNIDLDISRLLLTVVAGDDVTCTFINERASIINARKVNDLNGSGNFNSGETFLPGWTIQLYDSNNQLVDSQVTDGEGRVAFKVIAGDYKVCEVLQAGWDHTRPTSLDPTLNQPCYSVSILPRREAWLRFFNTQIAGFNAQVADGNDMVLSSLFGAQVGPEIEPDVLFTILPETDESGSYLTEPIDLWANDEAAGQLDETIYMPMMPGDE